MATKLCRVTGSKFETTPLEEELYRQFDVEVPDFVPSERRRLLLSLANVKNFFRRRSSLTGDPIYGVYSADSSFDVWETDLWLDARRAGKFGETSLDWNSKGSLFEQLGELFKLFPRPAFFGGELGKTVGSTQIFDADRVSYVSMASKVTDSSASFLVRNSENISNCFIISNSKECYGCINIGNCSRTVFSENSTDCSDSYFLFNCKECKHCTFCTGLTGKEYYFDNEELTPEEYAAKLADLELSSRGGLEQAKERFLKLREQNKSSDTIIASREVEHSFGVWFGFGVKDCIDLQGYSENISESVLSVGCGGGAKRIFNSLYCTADVEDLSYSAYCTKSRHLFGCFGLENREYCILNKQFKESEYFPLKEEIVSVFKKKKVWGRPFGMKFSDFPYNHSLAQDFFPITKVQSSLLEVDWDPQIESFQPSKLLESEASMSRLADAPESIENASREAIYICELSGRPFQYLPGELELCVKLGVYPSPYSTEERYRQTLALLKLTGE